MTSHYHVLKKAMHLCVAHADEAPTVEGIATALSISSAHLRRLFHEGIGVSPHQFMLMLRHELAAEELREGASVLEAALAVGASSTSRLYDLFVNLEGMTPGRYRSGGKGLTIDWDCIESPLGLLVIAATDRGISNLSFLDNGSDAAESRLQSLWPEARLRRDTKAIEVYGKEVLSRMRGEPPRKVLPLMVSGTRFQLQIWKALICLPEGHVCSYQTLARCIGRPQAARAVGNAVGANPIALLIPCHRVVKASGVSGNYRWGAERKKILIALEEARLQAPSVDSNQEDIIRAIR